VIAWTVFERDKSLGVICQAASHWQYCEAACFKQTLS